MVVTLAVLGVVSAVVGVYVAAPVESFDKMARRATLSDEADLALRRIARDLRAALPNSIRVTTDVAGRSYLECLEVRAGGRYRGQVASDGGGDPLDFSVADTSFDILGATPTSPWRGDISVGDRVVVFNTGQTGGDAYAGDNSAAISAVPTAAAKPNERVLRFAAKQFPAASPYSRFHVISGPVSYVCDPAAGTLTRHWGYSISASQPAPPSGGQSALLATSVSACGFSYTSGVLSSLGLASLSLTLTRSGAAGSPESVRLFSQIRVSGLP